MALTGPCVPGSRRREGSVEADLAGERPDRDAFGGPVRSSLQQQHPRQEGVSTEPDLFHTLRPPLPPGLFNIEMDNLHIQLFKALVWLCC